MFIHERLSGNESG